jgi:hypothetical protein
MQEAMGVRMNLLVALDAVHVEAHTAIAYLRIYASGWGSGGALNKVL